VLEGYGSSGVGVNELPSHSGRRRTFRGAQVDFCFYAGKIPHNFVGLGLNYFFLIDAE